MCWKITRTETVAVTTAKHPLDPGLDVTAQMRVTVKFRPNKGLYDIRVETARGGEFHGAAQYGLPQIALGNVPAARVLAAVAGLTYVTPADFATAVVNTVTDLIGRTTRRADRLRAERFTDAGDPLAEAVARSNSVIAAPTVLQLPPAGDYLPPAGPFGPADPDAN